MGNTNTASKIDEDSIEEEQRYRNRYTNAMNNRSWNTRIAQEVGLVGSAIIDTLGQFSRSWDQMTPTEKLPHISILGKEAMDLASAGFVFLELNAFAQYMYLTTEDLVRSLSNLIDEGLIEYREVKGAPSFRFVSDRMMDIYDSPRDMTVAHQFEYLAISKAEKERFYGRD